MIMMLRDDLVLELFANPDNPPDWIEGLDIENAEYEFCNEDGCAYLPIIDKPSSAFSQAKYRLRENGSPDPNNALAFALRAKGIAPNASFKNVDELIQFLKGRIIQDCN
jgi:hypothetical protein